jgi:RNA polymerase sigma factor (sigma-70 family)
MTHLATGSVTRQLKALFADGSAAGLSDRQLLERFNARKDEAGEAAFAALVARHGPMVLGVCRQLLHDRHLAEDAFQAVFLVLARKARSIRDPDRLGNWLYGVALRTARCARQQLARRRRNEEVGTMTCTEPVEPTAPSADVAVMAREPAEVLHGEIERLPEAFRLPVVLCYLEGLTVHEAARRLQWSHGTVRSRMARARDKLRQALIRRGFALSGAALAAVLDPRSASASVSSPLCDSATRAAIHFAAGPAAGEALAASTSALAQEVLRSMLLHKLKLVALTLLVLGAVAAGAGYSFHPTDAPAGSVGRGSHDPAQPPDRRSPERGSARTEAVAGHQVSWVIRTRKFRLPYNRS